MHAGKRQDGEHGGLRQSLSRLGDRRRSFSTRRRFPEGRTRWRKQAHAWLELDLAAWAGKLNDGISEDRRRLRSTLMRWLADTDLAALCEPGALKMLPVEERDEWLALWKGVDALIKRAIGA